MAFKMKGFPKTNDPKKEKLDNRSNIVQRMMTIKDNAKGREMSESEQANYDRLQTMLNQLN